MCLRFYKKILGYGIDWDTSDELSVLLTNFANNIACDDYIDMDSSIKIGIPETAVESSIRDARTVMRQLYGEYDSHKADVVHTCETSIADMAKDSGDTIRDLLRIIKQYEEANTRSTRVAMHCKKCGHIQTELVKGVWDA